MNQRAVKVDARLETVEILCKRLTRVARSICDPLAPHPSHSIKDACLEPLGLSLTGGAKVLGVAPHTFSRLIDLDQILGPARLCQFV